MLAIAPSIFIAPEWLPAKEAADPLAIRALLERHHIAAPIFVPADRPEDEALGEPLEHGGKLS
jgi:hypothetical protein